MEIETLFKTLWGESGVIAYKWALNARTKKQNLLVINGPKGSGKSTLARLLMSLNNCWTGDIKPSSINRIADKVAWIDEWRRYINNDLALRNMDSNTTTSFIIVDAYKIPNATVLSLSKADVNNGKYVNELSLKIIKSL